MTVNQKVKNLLNHGDKQRIADILETSHQNVARKIEADKEIDSVDFINAVCAVTGKPFTYFKPVAGFSPADALPRVQEPGASYEAEGWKERYEQAEKNIDILEQALRAKDDLIGLLREQVDSLKREQQEKKQQLEKLENLEKKLESLEKVR